MLKWRGQVRGPQNIAMTPALLKDWSYKTRLWVFEKIYLLYDQRKIPDDDSAFYMFLEQGITTYLGIYSYHGTLASALVHKAVLCVIAWL